MSISNKIGICICSCGLCSSKKELCNNCREATMKANGLPTELAVELKGADKNGWYGSDASNVVRKLVKRQQEQSEKLKPFNEPTPLKNLKVGDTFKYNLNDVGIFKVVQEEKGNWIETIRTQNNRTSGDFPWKKVYPVQN